MAPLKGILKNSGGQQQAEAGPSKPRAAPKTGSKGSFKVAVEKPASKSQQPKAKGGKGVKIVKPAKEEVDSEDDNDFGDDDDELDTEDEIERAQAGAAGSDKKPLSGYLLPQ